MRGRAYHRCRPGVSLARFSWANGISATRVAIVVPCVIAILQQAWSYAAACFVYAVISDFGDGIVARRRGEVSAFGGLLDHAADALFVTTALAALAALGLIPAVLPLLVAAAFGQYVWDSNALRGVALRASTLGRWNGIAYYVLTGIVVVGHALSPGWPPPSWSVGFAWLLVATTAVSMSDRAVVLWRLRQ
jgi:CDP-diacylglycerol---glycerol-3-phosphate 3-phosphatidyltransferase